MIMTKELVLKIFEGFSIERWNDLIRPFSIVEMDKAAEKMVAAYIIAKFEEENGNEIDWEWMIYASLFDLLRKIALCDMKSPVQRMIRTNYPEEYIRLNEWVLKQYEPLIKNYDPELFSKFTMYIGQTSASIPVKDKKTALSARVLRAAHKFSSLRELEMLSPVNEIERTQKIKSEVSADLEEFLDLKGMQLLITRQRPFKFVMMIEQLRFQTRWNQTPRVPATSVLGHCFYVAILTLLLSRDSQQKSGEIFSKKRLYNDFFSALFHDLPEAVTRDIISPVKKATDELPSIVKNIEDQIVRDELVPLMEDFYKDELMFFTSDEFEDRKFNGEMIDGRLVRVADHLSALVEADSSIKHGITSQHLESGRDNLLKSYKTGQLITGIDAGEIFNKWK